jgi:hypothetical protein
MWVKRGEILLWVHIIDVFVFCSDFSVATQLQDCVAKSYHIQTHKMVYLRVWHIPHGSMPDKHHHQGPIAQDANQEYQCKQDWHNVGFRSMFVRYIWLFGDIQRQESRILQITVVGKIIPHHRFHHIRF